MAALESKLGRALVARAGKVKLTRAIRSKATVRKSGNPVTMKFGADSSGLNKSVGFTNSSVLEQPFKVRMEKVCNVTGTTAFTVAQALYLNPGNSVLFPIFSQEAAVYEQFRVNTLRFWYRSREYTASGSNVGAGLVLLATNFDPDDAQFSSDTQMENYWHSTSDAPFAPSGKGVLVHDVLAGHRKAARNSGKRDATLNNYYVYSSGNSASPITNGAKFYDIGLFQFATSGNVSSSDVIGELWVEYSFTMIHPKQQTPLGQNLLSAHIVEAPAASAAASGGFFLGTSGGAVRSGSTLPTVTARNTFTLPTIGAFIIAGSWTGSVANVPTLTGGSNISNLSLLQDSSQSNESANSGNIAVIMWTCSVTSAGTGAANTVTITGLTSMAAGTADIVISQVPSGLLRPRVPAPDICSFTSSQVAKLLRLLTVVDDEPAVDRGDGVITISEPVTPLVGSVPTSHVPVNKLALLLSTLSK